MRVLVLRGRRAMRSHYMLGVSVVAVVVAAAGALGLFDADPADERRGLSAPGTTPLLPQPTAAATGPAPFLTVTYVLVSTEEERLVWDNVEETINQRELLSTMALEVLVVTNAEQEAAAYELIDAARAAYPWNKYVIEDLRME